MSTPTPPSHRRGLADLLGVSGLRDTRSGLYPLGVLLAFNAVDELDGMAFALLTPEIQRTFELSDAALGAAILGILLVNILLGLVVGYVADRANRVRIARVGAGIWAGFALLTGLAPAVAFLVVARIGSGLGKAVNGPTHRSLLADYYHPRDRAAVYSGYELANPLGKLLAPLVVGTIGILGFGWRPPFVVLAIPTVVVLVASFRLADPVRGGWERAGATVGGLDGPAPVGPVDSPALVAAMPVDEPAGIATTPPPNLREAMRLLRSIPTLRRAWWSLPFLVGGVIANVFLAPQFYDDVFGVSIAGRAGIGFGGELVGLVGLIVGVPIATSRLRSSPRRLFGLILVVGLVASGGSVVVATGPAVWVSIVGSMVIAFSTAIVLPTLSTLQSLLLPPQVRSMGFSIGALYALPGLLLIPLALMIGGAHGLRWAIGATIPMFLFGALVLASGGRTVEQDITAVRKAASDGPSHR